MGRIKKVKSVSLYPFEENRSLSELSTFKIGGPASYFAEIGSKEEASAILRFCKEKGLPFFVLGKGSNVLFDDLGFKGLVVANRILGISFEEKGAATPIKTFVHVGAGYSFSLLGMQTARRSLVGLEFASGIPASVGGAIYMNAGVGREQTSNCLTQVEFVDAEGELHILSKEELEFGYRTSSFQKKKGIIVGATFLLSFSEASEMVRARQKEHLAHRIRTQPYDMPSAGCVFRNPPEMPAGLLIDQCGLKGMRVGGAEVSSLHGNFIVNREDATAKDVLLLAEQVRQKVLSKRGILLEYEIRQVPYEL